MQLVEYKGFVPEVVENALAGFNPISLEEVNRRAKLMERFDYKTYFDVQFLPLLLERLSPFYEVMSIGNQGVFEYKTLYFDTADKKFYNDQHNGKANRYKVRARSYVQSDLHFLEVKFKNNKGLTVKKRTAIEALKLQIEGNEQFFLHSCNPNLALLALEPALWVHYQRITLVNKYLAQRLTIDINLQFDGVGKPHCLNNLVVVEVKGLRLADQSDATLIMRDMRLKPLSISKYALGMALSYNDLKKNNYKETLRSITSFKGIFN